MSEGKEVSVSSDENTLKNQDWYQYLIEECKAIITETRFNANVELIRGKWEMGRRIYQEHDRMERSSVYGKEIVQSIANDLGVSGTTIWQSIQFYKEYAYDSFDELMDSEPFGKSITWSEITKQHLGSSSVDDDEDGEAIEAEQEESDGLGEKRTFHISDILDVFKVYCMDEFNLGVNDTLLERKTAEFRTMLQELKGNN